MRCLLICGSPDCNSDFIKTQYKDGDFVVCADKGYEFCKNADITPDLIIGDFDSCQIDLPQDVKTIKLNPVKDDTDTLSCIKKALEYYSKKFNVNFGTIYRILDELRTELELAKRRYDDSRVERIEMAMKSVFEFYTENLGKDDISLDDFMTIHEVARREG